MRSVSPERSISANLPRTAAVALAVSAVAALCTFAFRFLAFRGLPNDQYMHLVWARHLLDGALPGRDFWEPGMPLAIAISAVVHPSKWRRRTAVRSTSDRSAMASRARSASCRHIASWWGSAALDLTVTWPRASSGRAPASA